MVGFPLSSYLSLLALALFYRIWIADRSFISARALWMVVAVILLPLHFQTVLIAAPPAIALAITYGRSPKREALLWVAIGVIASLVLNSLWLIPAFTHRGDEVSSAIVAQLPLFSSPDPLTFLKDYFSRAGYWTFRPSAWEKGLRWMLLILGWMGVFKLLRDGRREVGIMLATALGTLFLVAYFGSLIPFLKSWQPLRFKVSYDLFLVLTSSYLIAAWTASRISRSSSIFILFLLICGGIAFAINLAQTESKNRMRLRTETLPEVGAITDWIRDEAPVGGRVLFEESGDETGFVYDGMYLSSFLPYWTGRQLIGGPINLYNDRHHFAEFHSGILFKRDIATFTDDELRSYFLAYNIGAIVAFHPRSVQCLLSVPGLVSLDRRIGGVHLMKVDQPLNWFLKGKGSIEAGFNRIRVSNVAGEDILLKYHWTKGLVSDPPVTILPEKILDDPIPFIKIIQPPKELTLRIGIE